MQALIKGILACNKKWMCGTIDGGMDVGMDIWM